MFLRTERGANKMADEKKRILKLVESGKLSVDEAIALMEMVDKEENKKEQDIWHVDFEESKFQEKKKETASSFNFQTAKGKIFDFVDSTIKKVKEVDLDLNFGHYEEVFHIFQYTDIIPETIDIDIPNGDVELIPWENQEIRIECKAKVYRVDSLEDAKRVFLKEVDVAADKEKLEVKVHHKWMKLQTTIYVPTEEYKVTKIRLFNGPIKSNNLHSGQIYAKTANGKIHLTAIQAKKLEVDAANGSIDVEKTSATAMDAETINGAIHVDGYFERVDLQSFNGDIVCTNHSEDCEYIELKGTTGNMDVNIIEELAVNGNLKTNFGGFNVELEGIQIIEEKKDVLQKTLQFQSIQSMEKRTSIDANTKTGTIKIKKIGNQEVS